MKKILFFNAILFLSTHLFAQVGIGNTDPKSSLDISSSNVATPSNTDGILIPRMDDFPVTNPTIDQDGMMVFATGNGTPAKGFYYWDNGTSSWVAVSSTGAEKIDDLTDGKSDNDGTNDGSSVFLGVGAGQNDDSSNNQSVGVGYQALSQTTTGYGNVGVGNSSLLNNTTGYSNVGLGWSSLLANTIGFRNIGIGEAALLFNTNGDENIAVGVSALQNNLIGNNNVAFGFLAGFANTGSSNVFLGNRAGQNETGSNKLYIENSDANLDNALIYGDFGTDNTTIGNILRTNGEFQIGNPTGTGYAFPTIDGAASQVLTTDGAGQLSFSTVSGGDADWFEIGSTNPPNSIMDDKYTGGNLSIGKNTAAAGKVDIESTDKLRTLQLENTAAITGVKNGIFNSLSVTNNNGFSTGLTNVINGESNFKFGVRNFLGTNAATAINEVGVENVISSTGPVNIWGFNNYAVPSTPNSGLFRGFANTIGANHLGVITGYYNTISSNSNSTVFGLNNTIGGSGNAVVYGINTVINNTGSGDKYGDFITIDSALGGTHYGIYADAQKATGYAAYLIGRTSLGTGTTNRYLMPSADGTSGQVMTTNGAGQLSFTTLSLTDTQNTLDEAYDEGGAGAGRIITADNGAVSIEGNSGFQVTGTYNTGAPLALSGAGTRLFFNPRTSAFRAGTVDGSQWDLGNVGNFSMALGYNTVASAVGSIAIGNESSATANSAVALGPSNTASGGNSTAFGSANTASGANSTAFGFVNESSGYGSVAFGYRNTSHSSFETVLGTYATNYTPIESASNVTDPSDRALVVGNGTSNAARSNALTLYKDGSLNINDAYTLPNSDGTTNQVLTTDGAGITSWQDNPANFALAKMTMSSNQTITSTTKLNFDTAAFDLNGNFNTTTDRFEVTETGYYRINASFRNTGFVSTNLIYNLSIRVNGALVKINEERHHGASDFVNRTVESMEYLTAGDYIEIYAGGSLTISSASQVTRFEVERIR